LYIIYFALGIVLGKKILSKPQNRRASSRKEVDEDSKKVQVAKTKKTFTTYIKNDDSKRELKPEDININIKPQINNIQPTSKPNFIALTVLWSHFKALEENKLKEDLPAPWEQYEADKYISNKRMYLKKQKRWKSFLQEIIDDTSWTKWINNSREVYEHAIEAYKKID